MSALTVLLVEDHQVVRQGLRSLLEAEPNLTVVGEAENGRQAVEKALELQPNLVVMDVSMPQLNGLEAARQILHARPKTRIILLSAHGENAYVEKAMQYGVSAYILKQASLAVLSKAIREVVAGRTFFGASVDVPGRTRPTLTMREAEVLQLVAEGRASKMIAHELGISVKTVDKHRQHVMEKLGIHDTAGLTRYALSMGIVEANYRGDQRSG